MLQTQQNKLAQTTNISLVKIRIAELNYFNNFFLGFGFQIGLIASFNLNEISQTVSSGATCSSFWLYLYWINNSLGSIFGINAILIALITNVYGQGLALRGPVGSMISAVNGMIDEQQSFLLFFTLCTICTTLAQIGNFYIMMNLSGAWAAGSILFFGMFYWYISVVRIYNRFKLHKTDTQFGIYDQRTEFEDEYSSSVDKPRSPLVGVTETASAPAVDSSDSDPGLTASLKHAGYITLQSGPSRLWVRHYMVLKGSFALYYSSKLDFETRPMEPVNARPILLDDYVLEVQSNKEQQSLMLLPADPDDPRKVWEFRFDTEAEFEAWKRAFASCTRREFLGR